ncbi:Bax inhibitor-1/YccA family membrane protein [Candidatus Phytoplasma palmae]|uniref:Bax inhibitor-1/YccA family membrane protein n=1 Tax=Candidatus Phytoplasma palmae TaxID=85624 RepID=UPI0039905BD8
MNKKTIFKNNPLIERIKNEAKTKSRKFAKLDDKNICSKKSISLKTFFLFLCTIATSITTYRFLLQTQYYTNFNFVNKLFTYVFLLSIIQFILVIMINMVNIRIRKFIAISFALIEGINLSLFLSFLNIAYKNAIEGITIALTSTILLFTISHFLYSCNIIKINQKFRSFLLISLLLLIVMQFFRLLNFFSLLITVFSLFLGCMSLAVDFEDADFIISNRLHKDNEWNIALGFHITLIWIFKNLINLLQILGFFKKYND